MKGRIKRLIIESLVLCAAKSQTNNKNAVNKLQAKIKNAVKKLQTNIKTRLKNYRQISKRGQN